MSTRDAPTEIRVFLFIVVAVFSAVVLTMVVGPNSPIQQSVNGGQMQQNVLIAIVLLIAAAVAAFVWYLREVL